MSHQILKQPNGKYLVFSAIVDAVVLHNCSEEDLVQKYLKIEEDKIRKGVKDVIDKIEKGEQPYYQFTRSLEEVLELHNKNSEEKLYTDNL